LYKKTRTQVIVVLRVPSTIYDTCMASTDVTWLTAYSGIRLVWADFPYRTPHSRTNIDKTCQLTGTVRGPARRPHFSLAIISVIVQLST